MSPEQWQEHIEAYQKTHLSKRAYAESNDLVYSQFLYWCRKHCETSLSNNGPTFDSPNPFISVTAQSTNPQPSSGLGTVEFPGGIRLVIHQSELLQPLLTLCLSRSL